jgi:hypothetical protein
MLSFPASVKSESYVLVVLVVLVMSQNLDFYVTVLQIFLRSLHDPWVGRGMVIKITAKKIIPHSEISPAAWISYTNYY